MSRPTYSVSSAQSQLPRLIKDAEAGDAIAISRRDVTVAYILSRDHLEAIVETMEILANPAARKAIEDHRAGRLRFVPLRALGPADE
jgi:PHD/YefM family antitoxin component YafN of YafNO toxin-antitoxin module